MEFFKKSVVSVLMLFLSTSCGNLYSSPIPVQQQTKILFIGSSYFNFNNLPALFKNLARISGKEVSIDRQITNGLYLDDHANSSLTEAKINEQEWDYVILHGVGRTIAYPDSFNDHPVYPALIKLRDKIAANCESTKMVFCLPWAFEDGMTWVEGWTDTYKDMQLKIYENTLQYSDDVGFIVAPVGWAWNTVLEQKNYPLHYLHLSDWNHPSLRGSYLMACVIYSTLYQESSVNIQYYGGLPEQEALYFQTVGSNTVIDSLELWNIITTKAEMNEFSVPENFNLHQNYPNPFNACTEILYEVPFCCHAEISVYDILGKIHVLVSEDKMPGKYAVTFDGNGFKSGLYIYRLKIGAQYLRKKMILVK